ncbi:MAG: hypothetical protein P8X96_10570 [Desulfobacteraceae bacterium]
MKKLKYAFWLIIIGFFGVVIAQNWDYFTTENSLKLNLYVYNEPIPPMTNGAIIAICVGVSVLIMLLFYFASRYETYRAKKTINSLRHGMEEGKKSISDLQHEVELLKGGSPTPLNDLSDNEERAENEEGAEQDSATRQEIQS